MSEGSRVGGRAMVVSGAFTVAGRNESLVKKGEAMCLGVHLDAERGVTYIWERCLSGPGKMAWCL